MPKHKSKTRGRRTKDAAEATEQLAYRFVGYPSKDAQDYLNRVFGCCRFIWNQMLADREAVYKATGKTFKPMPAQYKGKHPWLKEVDSLALVNVQLNLENAYQRFFEDPDIFGHPVFKKKGYCKRSFTTNVASKGATNLNLIGNKLKLPKLKETIPLDIHRPIKDGGTLKNCTVTQEPDGKWMFALVFEYRKEPVDLLIPSVGELKSIGLDMSLPQLYVDSNGESPAFSKPYRRMESRIAKEQRKLSHMKKYSSNYKKQKQKIAKLCAKAKHQRSDLLHKTSAMLVKDYDVIGIEDLDMSAMKKALKLGKSVTDIGWGMFTRMLEYKSEKHDCVIIKIDRWFPSSKLCGNCGYIHKELKLSDRVYICPYCGHVIGRDLQAAQNIKAEALRIYHNSCNAA